MVRTSYYLRGAQTSKGQRIDLCITYQGKRFQYFADFHASEKTWSNARQRVIGTPTAAMINNKLDILEREAERWAWN